MCDKPAILLVDDQPDFLENLSLTLESAGYRTISAADGLGALAALKSQPVHLILSDIGMPQMGGYRLLKQVQQNPGWAAIPFVFLTGYALPECEMFSRQQLGITGYLTKPIRATELLAAVKNMLAVKSYS